MMAMTDDSTEPCRLCGIFYITATNFLREFFPADGNDSEMEHIIEEVARWGVNIKENDGFPQYVCKSCVVVFADYFKIREASQRAQAIFTYFQQRKEANQSQMCQVKTEVPDPDANDLLELDVNNRIFIYVDDLSDDDYDGGTTKFNIPHVPIKLERFEEDTMPSGTKLSNVDPVEPLVGEQDSNSQQSIKPQIKLEPGIEFGESMEETVQKLRDEMVELKRQVDSAKTTSGVAKSSGVTCKLCTHISKTERGHASHMDWMHHLKDFECRYCGKTFPNYTKQRFNVHQKFHRARNHIKCAKCGVIFNSGEKLKQHMRVKHTKVNCTECDQLFLPRQMKSHMKGHIMTEWECTNCDEVFFTENDRDAHIWRAHAREQTRPPTESNELSTNSHINSQPDDLRDIDDIHVFLWGKDATNESDDKGSQHNNNTNESTLDGNRISHQNRVMSFEIERQEQDSFRRDEGDESDTTMNSDSESLEDAFSFSCAVCAEKFVTIDQLQDHHQVHKNKSSPLNCPLCDKTFALKFTLNRHMKKHTTDCF